MRSWLFVRPDSDKQLGKAPQTGADVLVIDLATLGEGAIDPPILARAAEWLAAHRSQVTATARFGRWVRLRPLETADWQDDLAVVMGGAPDGVILPRASEPEQVRTLASALYENEQRHGIAHNTTRIVLQLGETAAAALTMRGFLADPHLRLAGLAWNAAGLAQAIGATRLTAGAGRASDALALVRAETLLLAKAMGLMAIESAASDPADAERGAAEALAARRDGFNAMAAVHPRHIPAINHAFLPTAAERAEAQAIVAAFDAHPGAQMVAHRGQQIDRAALARAQQLLALS